MQGSAKAAQPAPPEMHLSDWLEVEVLYREAEPLLKTPESDRDDTRP